MTSTNSPAPRGMNILVGNNNISGVVSGSTFAFNTPKNNNKDGQSSSFFNFHQYQHGFKAVRCRVVINPYPIKVYCKKWLTLEIKSRHIFLQCMDLLRLFSCVIFFLLFFFIG